MFRSARSFPAPLALVTALMLLGVDGSAQRRHYPLESLEGLRLVNVKAEPATLEGKKGLRVIETKEEQS